MSSGRGTRLSRFLLVGFFLSLVSLACSGRIHDARDPALDRTRFGLTEGKPTLLVFSAGWCQPCREELDYLNKLSSQYGARMQFVGYLVEGTQKFSHPTDSDTAAFRSLTNAAPLFPVRADGDWSRYSEVNVTGERSLPYFALVDSKGRVRLGINSGKNPDLDLGALIERFLADESAPIPVPTVAPENPDPGMIPDPFPSPTPSPTGAPDPGATPVPTATPDPVVVHGIKIADWLVDPLFAPSEETRARFEDAWKQGRDHYQWSEEDFPFPAGKITFSSRGTAVALSMGYWRSDTCELKVFVSADGTYVNSIGRCFSQ